MFDVCIFGHITKDLIRIPGKRDQQMAGGSAYYAALALRSLGLDVAVVTKVARDDERRLLGPLMRRGISVYNGATETTTVFENAYADAQLTSRKQWVRSIAAPFEPDDAIDIDARAFHFGPLTRDEIPVELLEHVRGRTDTLSLDAQGMLRRVIEGVVQLGSWSEAARALPHVDVLKVDDLEAEKIAGERNPEKASLKLARLGAKEVLVTFAHRGSIVRHRGRCSRIPAIRPERPVDATGCGDTYAAGYLYRRLEGADPVEAAWFAAATASLKLERYGAFEDHADAVHERLEAGVQQQAANI
jgi:sugar/nucleoside kinase (ribokinase family)